MTNKFDFLVVGTGPTSEPAIHHLSKTNLSVCIIDASSLFASDQNANNSVKQLDMNIKEEARALPVRKQIFNLAISPKLQDNRIIIRLFTLAIRIIQLKAQR